MDRFDPFAKYADVYGDIINWEKDPMNKPQNQNKYFFSDGKTYYEQICKMLRLMSVFKEAFNQIYNNEDEISGAWENFVNNLSASVVEGNEPDVTLTWTDDSVNFEFTMVPGVPGDPGVGIASISFNSDYTMTITLSDGTTYTSMSLKGDTGPQGPQGETGSGLQILDVYATLADLQSAHPTGQPGDAYQVGSAGNYTLYIWSSSQSAWVQAGTLGTVSPYTSAPLMDGTASAGSQNLYARGDHVHPSDTSRASKEELDALIRTSQALIDQSFTYRESPAIQDGLARIDKIKGNTLVWNQLISEQYSYTFTAGGSNQNVNIQRIDNIVAGHKYLYAITQANSMSSNVRNTLQYLYSNGSNVTVNESNVTNHNLNAGRYSWIFTAPSDNQNNWISLYYWCHTPNVAVTINDAILVDLTLMFGTGNEPATGEEFASLFSLPFYDLNTGTLLPFNGTGLKTVGFNQWDEEWEVGAITAQGQPSITADRIRSKNFIPVMPNTTYYRKSPNNIQPFFYDANQQFIEYGYWNTGAFPTPSNCAYMKFQVDPVYGLVYKNDICINISNTELNGKYEAYKEASSSFPISQYFPNGMKSAGSAYDELADSKAITRLIKTVVDGTNVLASYYGSFQGHQLFYIDLFATTYVSYANMANLLSNLYETANNVTMDDKHIRYQASDNQVNIGRIYWNDDSYTSANAMNTALQSNPLEIISLAQSESSLDVDLDLDFMAYENGTEQLLPINGSVPSTSPIIADMTYLSIDDAMEYVLEKLEAIPEQTEQRLEALEDDVADLQTDVGALQPAVSALQTSVGNINTNIGQLSSTVAGHTASISDMQSDISDISSDVSDLSTDVGANTGMINQLTSSLASTDGRVTNLSTSVSGLESTVTAQGTTVTALDSIIQDISNNPVIASLGQHELGLVAAYVDATLPANTGTMVTIPKPTIFPSNYTPLFIVGMSTGSYNVSICSIPYGFGNADSVTCRVWNHGSQQTTQITVYILCMRQRQSQ